MRRVLGIDPGKEGGLALLFDMSIERLSPMPVVTGKEVRSEYDLPVFRDLVVSAKPDLVVVERLHAMPSEIKKEIRQADGSVRQETVKSGSIANYQRGYAMGAIEGMLVVLGLRYVLVPPKTWQSLLLYGVNTTDTKQAALLVAKRTWPKQNWLMSAKARKPHDGVVDAALIAFWGVKKGL